jgi:hypothetical protein
MCEIAFFWIANISFSSPLHIARELQDEEAAQLLTPYQLAQI